MLTENVPEQLKVIPRWVCWRSDVKVEGEKQPIDCRTGQRADITNSSCWVSFDDAIAYYREHALSGAGLVLTNDGYSGATLDDCYDEKTHSFQQWAKDILLRLDSYCELSPMGTGVTVFVKGLLPQQERRKGKVTLYSNAHFLAVTGRRLTSWRGNCEPVPVEARQPELLRLFHELRDGKPVLTDEELLSRAMKAANGEKFKVLWEGDTTGYQSQSEADLALCCLLGFWTQGDGDRIDALFRQSALSRKKWLNRDYRERTIRQAQSGLMEFYSPKARTLMLTSVTRINQLTQEDPEDPRDNNNPDGEYPIAMIEQGMEMALDLAETVGDIPDWEASFKLARRLRKLTDNRPEQFEAAIKAFCEKTKRPFEAFWYDYIVVWDKVKSAEGDDVLGWAMAKAKEDPYTHISCSIGALYVTIASLSWQLSRLTGGKPFWLPRKRLGELYEVAAMTITRVVMLLEKNGIIKCVNASYKFTERKAKEYTFVGPTQYGSITERRVGEAA